MVWVIWRLGECKFLGEEKLVLEGFLKFVNNLRWKKSLDVRLVGKREYFIEKFIWVKINGMKICYV